ncbi:MAG TPA: Fe-Mn family superoxide dismutase [Blastocatellia bacterium]|nr:Fe-Mn family superoxide dismutase [Blastocatellia bacterium]
MSSITRRKAIETMLAGSAGAALAGLHIEAQNSTTASAFRGQHQLRPLPFDAAKLKGLSEKLIRSHWENNYSGAVRALNAVEQRLAAMLSDKDLPAYVYGDLKREELVRTGSVVLHEIYFGNLGGDGKAAGDILNALKQTWGSYEQWEAEFKRTGNALGGGSGRVILAHNFHTGELHNYWSWDHMHNAPFSRPLLAMDMYEHSYQMDYGAAAAKYIDAFMQNVNWEEVNRRFTAAQKAAAAMKA